jgi:hypothetical protein
VLDLWIFVLSVCTLIWMSCINVIRDRLKTQDGVRRSGFIWGQPNNFAQYWNLARAQGWPVAPLLGAVIAIMCCVIALGGIGAHFLR